MKEKEEEKRLRIRTRSALYMRETLSPSQWSPNLLRTSFLQWVGVVCGCAGLGWLVCCPFRAEQCRSKEGSRVAGIGPPVEAEERKRERESGERA